MSHIKLPKGLPGIVGPMMLFPQTGDVLSALAGALLDKDSPNLPRWKREFLAAYVSWLNRCEFCFQSHIAAARALGSPWGFFSDEVPEDVHVMMDVVERLTTNLKVPEHAVDDLRDLRGFSDEEIHDVILIGAAFNMYNRYVLGLDAPEPASPLVYKAMGQRLATEGYGQAARKQQFTDDADMMDYPNDDIKAYVEQHRGDAPTGPETETHGLMAP